jgi:hypothetical protein
MKEIAGKELFTAIPRQAFYIEIGGWTRKELMKVFKNGPFSLGPFAEDMMLDSLNFNQKLKKTPVIIETLRGLGFTRPPKTRNQIIERGAEHGFGPLPEEAGPYVRLQIIQPYMHSYEIVTKPILTEPYKDKYVWRLERDGNSLRLGGEPVNSRFNLGDAFLFEILNCPDFYMENRVTVLKLSQNPQI